MIPRNMSPLERHSIAEAFNPSADTEQWMAFIVLKHLYPTLTYLSFDGYHCHGLADYTEGLYWQGWGYAGGAIIDTKTGDVVVLVADDFTNLNKTDIVNIWTDAIKTMRKYK